MYHRCERFATAMAMATFQHTSGHHVTGYCHIQSRMTLVVNWLHLTNLVIGADAVENKNVHLRQNNSAK